MTDEEIQWRKRILLTTYASMLGNINGHIRSISIDWTNNSYKIKAFFDRPVTDDDRELISEIIAGIAASIPEITDYEEIAENSTAPGHELQHLRELVFLRAEEFSSSD